MASGRLKALSVAAIVSLLFAGCVGKTSDPDPTSHSASETQTTTTGESSKPPRDSRVPLEVAFTSCRTAGTVFDYPESVGPGDYPSAWPAPDPVNIDEVLLSMAECNRISWGPFERGPIRLLFELHDRLNPPGNCTNHDGTDGFISLWILNSLWIDDEELANYLKVTYDLPTIFAQMSVKDDLQSGIGTQVWSWNEPGKPSSQVTYYVANSVNATDVPYTDRMYWYNETTLSYVNLRIVANVDQVNPGITPGTMQPPMLYTYNGMTSYIGTGQKFDSMELSANLKRYGDFKCERPLPS